jgi:hypothetical protein
LISRLLEALLHGDYDDGGVVLEMLVAMIADGLHEGALDFFG